MNGRSDFEQKLWDSISDRRDETPSWAWPDVNLAELPDPPAVEPNILPPPARYRALHEWFSGQVGERVEISGSTLDEMIVGGRSPGATSRDWWTNNPRKAHCRTWVMAATRLWVGPLKRVVGYLSVVAIHGRRVRQWCTSGWVHFGMSFSVGPTSITKILATDLPASISLTLRPTASKKLALGASRKIALRRRTRLEGASKSCRSSKLGTAIALMRWRLLSST
jgi:hypothetical protein